MKDRAKVVTTENDTALVIVNPQMACQDCSAKTLCLGQKNPDGFLRVLNPLKAKPGDDVEIEVPETDYAKDLIRMFGLLLLASIAGFILGYMASPLLGIPQVLLSLLGLSAGVAAAGIFLFRWFRGRASRQKYPYIFNIMEKGATHG